MSNQNTEQKARDTIDLMLSQADWIILDKYKLDFVVGLRINFYRISDKSCICRIWG
jgi:hypothetical protein